MCQQHTPGVPDGANSTGRRGTALHDAAAPSEPPAKAPPATERPCHEANRYGPLGLPRGNRCFLRQGAFFSTLLERRSVQANRLSL